LRTRKYQHTDSVNYLIEAAYSVSFMTSETYPSVPGAGDRRTVTYTPDAADRLASLNSNATTYAPAASVSSIGYASHNARVMIRARMNSKESCTLALDKGRVGQQRNRRFVYTTTTAEPGFSLWSTAEFRCHAKT